MPLVEITSLTAPTDVDVSALLLDVVDGVGPALGIDAGRVFATYAQLAPGCQMDARTTVDEQPHDSHPPIAHLCAYEGRTEEQISAALEAIVSAIDTHLPVAAGRAFVTFRELASGRVFTGGEVRRTAGAAPQP